MLNDAETNIDLLGYSRIAETIVTLCWEEHMSPLTMGVFGDWGAGKSSVLKLVEENLSSSSEVSCLTFNGWLFQGYDDAKATMMEAIIGELRKQQPTNEKLKRKAKEMLARVDWLKLARRTAGLAFMGLAGVPDPLLLSQLLGKLKDVVSAPTDAITVEQLRAVGGALQSSIKEADAKTIPDEILAFRRDFAELIESAGLKRLVVLVDDLDRCLPETTIDVLEAMRLFLYVPGTVFILGADERMIAYAVRRHFPDLPVGVGPSDYTRNYLEKLVQVPFRVPPLGQVETRTYVTLLLAEEALRGDDESLGKLRGAAGKVLSRPWEKKKLDEDAIQAVLGNIPEALKPQLLLASRISPVLAVGLNGNPRQIKRFLNTMIVRIQIAKAHGIGGLISRDALAKLMLLERFHESAYVRVLTSAVGSENGHAEELAALEDHSRNGPTQQKPQKGHKKIEHVDSMLPPEWQADQDLLRWARIEPPLGSVDLRPYFFISQEKSPKIVPGVGLGEELEKLTDALASGNNLLIVGTKAQLTKLNEDDAHKLFDHLVERAKLNPTWKSKPREIEGLYALCREQPTLQESLVGVLAGLPVEELGTWAAVGLKSVLTDDAAKKRFDTLQTSWRTQSVNPELKSAVEGMSTL